MAKTAEHSRGPLTQFSPLLTPYMTRVPLSTLRRSHWHLALDLTQDYLSFTSFSVNVLFLFQDPLQGTTLCVVIPPPQILLLCDNFLVFHDLASLEKFGPGIL